MNLDVHELHCKVDGGKLLSLAQKVFGNNLNEAEKALFRKIGILFGSSLIKDGESAEELPVIHADKVAWLLQDPKAQQFITPRGLVIFNASILGPLDLTACKADVPLLLVCCTIKGKLSLPQARLTMLALTGTKCSSVFADGIKVTADIKLNDGFEAQDEVRLLNSTVGGNLDCSGGKFYNKGQRALSADGIHVTRSIFLSNGFEAQGEVRFLGATVGGNFQCNNGMFCNEGKMALSADGIKVTGTIYLKDFFQAEGMIDFVNAQVQDGFVYTHAKSPEKASLRLNHARVGVLWDMEKSWPDPGNLYLDNFHYDRIEEKSPLGVRQRLDWLSRQPEDSYHPQPYEQLATVYKKSGRSEDARRIQYAKNEHRMKCIREGILKVSWYERLWLGILWIVVGYGYRPHYALGWWVLLVLTGRGFFYNVDISGEPIASALNLGADGKPLTEFSPFFFSLDAAIPLVELRHSTAWYLPGLADNAWYSFEVVAGWVLVSLFILTIVGVIRK